MLKKSPFTNKTSPNLLVYLVLVFLISLLFLIVLFESEFPYLRVVDLVHSGISVLLDLSRYLFFCNFY